MITYKIQINGVTIKRIDASRLHSRNTAMDKTGYQYKYQIYDYENEKFEEGECTHKYQDGCGKLLSIILNQVNNEKTTS